MINLQIYVVDGAVVWRMIKLRPAAEWRTAGPTYWERRGDVHTDEHPQSDREAISLAPRAIQARLGEREHLGGSGG